MSNQRNVYPIEIAGIYRELSLFEVQPGLKIAILNILGDTELATACAEILNEKLNSLDYDVILTAEAKSIPLAHALSQTSRKPYIVLRKQYRNYMGKTIQAETVSITTGRPQQLFLDEKDIELMRGKRILLIDDVISTGSTLQGMRTIVGKAAGEVAGMAAILTEGDQDQWADIVSLGHLPLFTE